MLVVGLAMEQPAVIIHADEVKRAPVVVGADTDAYRGSLPSFQRAQPGGGYRRFHWGFGLYFQVHKDDELEALMQVQTHVKTITHRESNATLKVVAADSNTVGGKKSVGTLGDEPGRASMALLNPPDCES